MGCTKKLIPQFYCTYYPALFLHSYSIILSIQIVDSLPVERFFVPAPGLKQTRKINGVFYFPLKFADATLAHLQRQIAVTVHKSFEQLPLFTFQVCHVYMYKSSCWGRKRICVTRPFWPTCNPPVYIITLISWLTRTFKSIKTKCGLKTSESKCIASKILCHIL